MNKRRKFAEFFSGSGMARAGLGIDWVCSFANDINERKSEIYALNWGSAALHVGDIGGVSAEFIPEDLALAWASFPCQDLSQAGAGAGLMGGRSGVFWPFWELLKSLPSAKQPTMVVLENVPGAVTSHGGRDFEAICEALAQGGYRFGAILLNASHFVPQSRVRLFIIAVLKTAYVPEHLYSAEPSSWLAPKALRAAVKKLPQNISDQWLWWQLRVPEPRATKFSDLLLADDDCVKWHSQQETNAILNMMSPLNLKKIEAAKLAGRSVVGSIYKRRRCDGRGGRVQRAEVRFDDVAGCLRTPTGGASRQTIISVDGERIRSRILQPREAARLMGLDDSYMLPDNYYEAYHLVGDGVVVPAVRYLASNLFEPILDAKKPTEQLPTSRSTAAPPAPSLRRRGRLPLTERFCWRTHRARRLAARSK